MCRSVEMRIPDFAAITLKLLFACLTFPASAFDSARNFSSFFLNYLEFVNTRVSYSSQFESQTRLHNGLLYSVIHLLVVDVSCVLF